VSEFFAGLAALALAPTAYSTGNEPGDYLGINFIDLDRRKLLPMSLLATKSFSSFILENNYFRSFALFDNMAANRHIAQDRLANFHVFAIGIQKHVVECNFLPDLAW
jgi:hypothetical protein